MRSTCLVLIAAVPAICASQPRSVVQIPLVVTTDGTAANSYAQWAPTNGTIASAKPSMAEVVNSTSSPSAAVAAADIRTPGLDKSIFSLIVFGIAGICLL